MMNKYNGILRYFNLGDSFTLRLEHAIIIFIIKESWL